MCNKRQDIRLDWRASKHTPKRERENHTHGAPTSGRSTSAPIPTAPRSLLRAESKERDLARGCSVRVADLPVLDTGQSLSALADRLTGAVAFSAVDTRRPAPPCVNLEVDRRGGRQRNRRSRRSAS